MKLEEGKPITGCDESTFGWTRIGPEAEDRMETDGGAEIGQEVIAVQRLFAHRSLQIAAPLHPVRSPWTE